MRKYYFGDETLKNGKSGAVYATERLMRTELARVQTEVQKQSFQRNGFEMYEFIANGDCCDICKEMDGKHFEVSEMMPGENAPPMHPNCRCSVAAWVDDEEYDAWVDYLSNGGTTAEWNESGKAEWKRFRKSNLAKAIDSIKVNINNPEYSREDILKELQKSPIGKDTIRAIRDGNVQIQLMHGEYHTGYRGEQNGNNIKLYLNNIKNLRVAGQTLVHEMAHNRFKIGGCQYAEAICFAMEKMHIMGRDYLTQSEWEYVKKLAIDNYPEYNWKSGGYGNYDQFKFIKSE